MVQYIDEILNVESKKEDCIMPENKVRQLTYGAISAALFVLLMVLANVPLVTIITTWFVPLPIAYYASKFDVKSSIIVAIVGSLLSFIILGVISGVMGIFFAIIGIAMSININNKRSKVETLFAVSMATLLMGAATVFAYIQFTGVNIIEKATTGFEKSMNQSYEISKKLAESTGQKPQMTQEQLDLAISQTMHLMPGIIIVAAFGWAIVILALNFPLLKKLGVPVQSFGKFKDMRLPKFLLIIYLVIILVRFIAAPEEGSYLYAIILNGDLILSCLFLIQGISFIHFLVHRSNMPKVVAWIATILALPLSSFVVLLGIVDLGFDIRKLLGDKTKK